MLSEAKHLLFPARCEILRESLGLLSANVPWSKLPCMRQRWGLVCVLVAVVVLMHMVTRCSAQTTDKSDTQSGVFLSKLAPPVYPRLAQMARILGDVDVTVRVRRDGSVESAALVSGHPMLVQAALLSARQSQFEYHECSDEVTSYSLTYKFQIAPRDPPKNCLGERDAPPPQPEVDLAHGQITVFAWELWTCDPAVEIRKFRSRKCLYLWRCGVSERALD
jgi:TonB family protein